MTEAVNAAVPGDEPPDDVDPWEPREHVPAGAVDAVHVALHEIKVTIPGIPGDHHCNIVAGVVFKALIDAGCEVKYKGYQAEHYGTPPPIKIICDHCRVDGQCDGCCGQSGGGANG